MLMKRTTRAASPGSALVKGGAYTETFSTKLGATRRLLIIAMIVTALLSTSVLGVVFYTSGYINDTIANLERVRAQNALTFMLERGETLDTAALNRLALEQGLTGAHIDSVDDHAHSETRLPLLDGTGRSLAWTSRQLGTEIYATLAPIRICGTILFLLMSGFLLRRLYMVATELEARRRDAHELARRDQLTGLGNRLAFDEAIAIGLASGRSIGLLSLDLDDFKGVNDTLGHGAGDELLQRVGGRIRSCAHSGDLVTRIGGDEFTVICLRDVSRADLEELARDIETALSAPFAIGSHSLDVHASTGIALAPDDGRDAETLLRHADLALYRAKRTTRQILQVDRLRAVG